MSAFSSPAPRAVQACYQRRWASSKRINRLRSRVEKPLDREIFNDFALLRDNYAVPKHTIVLAHGLFGFSQLDLSHDLGLRAGLLPPIHYWHGIVDALASRNVRVVTTSVPPSASIQHRANHLAQQIATLCPGEPVSVIAHSMGGLDARCMLSSLRPARDQVDVRALVTIATPHRGSYFANYLHTVPLLPLPRLYGLLRRVGLGTEAFQQLTTGYMQNTFNPLTPDVEGVRYFSYGATTPKPSLLSLFWLTHRIIRRREGPNDGLVSVESSRWGSYKGTLVNVSHFDLINWTNVFARTARHIAGVPDGFSAIAFYLAIADMLAKEGL
ncbi:lipase 2 [Ceratocystis pirilliformis]|uniref:Lipase 2 n=1 Tax=Ceratocystis pirilliformis TaxID=259994 RepID=A0ABR3ZLC4_9PEZI